MLRPYSKYPLRLILLLLIAALACQLTNDPPSTPEAVITLAEATAEATATTQLQPSTPTAEVTPPSAAAVPTITTLTPTAIPTATNTPIPWMETAVIGLSVQGRPVEATRLGTGERWFVVIAAIHGAHECNTNELALGMLARITAEPTLLPEDITLYIVPLANPDGCALNSRYNANNVDLNRNWAAGDWTADAEGPGGVIAGSGGSAPFSEPETAALQSWLQQLKQQSPDGELRIVSYHSAVPDTGLAQPAYAIYGQPEPRSEALARTYAGETGYLYSAVWVGTYTITGEFIHWAGENGFIAFDVELPDRNTADSIPAGWTETHIETNLQGLLAILNQS